MQSNMSFIVWKIGIGYEQELTLFQWSKYIKKLEEHRNDIWSIHH